MNIGYVIVGFFSALRGSIGTSIHSSILISESILVLE
jgi:hypothetical protein